MTFAHVPAGDSIFVNANTLIYHCTWADRFYSVTQGTAIMAITIDAIYENGVLKPAEPLPLKEQERVRVTVELMKERAVTPPDEAERIVRRSYGLLGWTGDVKTLRRVIEDPEFSLLESP